MKIAIAGAGELARYFYEEFPRQGHETVAITRTHKTFLDDLSIEQRITDYTVDSLTTHLADCEVVISTILGQGAEHINAHLALLEACKRTRNCKRMIPSEWSSNIEDYPDQPMCLAETREPIRRALAAQKEIEWTLVMNGWFMEYVFPQQQRYFSDCKDGWPMEYAEKVFVLYEKGEMPVTLTSARDVARAMARLVEKPDWEPYTYLAGETLRWKDLFEILHERDPAWRVERRTLAEAVRQIVAVETAGAFPIMPCLQLLGYTNYSEVPPDKAERQREKYFPEVHFCRVKELLDEAKVKSVSFI